MGRKSKSDERRPEILKFAYHAARKHGITGLTLSRIASGMDVAPSLLSHYFRTKQDIILGLIDWMVARYDETLLLDFEAIPSPADRLAALLDARLWEFTRTVIDDRVWFDAFALAHRDEAVMAKFRALYERDLEAVIGSLADRHRDHPEFRRQIHSLAGAIIAASEGMNFFARVNPDEEMLEDTAKNMKRMIMDQFEAMRNTWESEGTTRHAGKRRKQ